MRKDETTEDESQDGEAPSTDVPSSPSPEAPESSETEQPNQAGQDIAQPGQLRWPITPRPDAWGTPSQP